MAPPPMCDSAVSPCFHDCLAFLHRHFPSWSPSHPRIHLSIVNSSCHPEIAPQFLNSSSQPLHLPGDLHPCPGCVWLRQGLSVLVPFRLPQISCFTLRLKCFSSDPDNCPTLGIRPLLQFPQPLRAGQLLLILLFFSIITLPLYFHFSTSSCFVIKSWK